MLCPMKGAEEQGDVGWSLGGAACGLRGCGGRRGPAAVQVFDVEHDELPALLRDALQDEVALVVLQDLLHVLQVLLRLLDQLSRPATHRTSDGCQQPEFDKLLRTAMIVGVWTCR